MLNKFNNTQYISESWSILKSLPISQVTTLSRLITTDQAKFIEYPLKEKFHCELCKQSVYMYLKNPAAIHNPQYFFFQMYIMKSYLFFQLEGTQALLKFLFCIDGDSTGERTYFRYWIFLVIEGVFLCRVWLGLWRVDLLSWV